MQTNDDSFNFKIHLKGKALSEHSIDAKEFGLSLIGLNETLDAIAQSFGTSRQQTSLKVQANLQPGSVIALLQLIVATAGGAPSLFSDVFSISKHILECLTLLVRLKQEYQDREVSREQVDAISQSNNYYNCTFNNFSDQSKQVACEIHNSGSISNSLIETFSPLKEGNMTENFEILDQNNQPFIQLNRDGFKRLASVSAKEPQTQPVLRRIDATIVGLRFDNKSWTVSANGTEYTAKVRDEDFLKKVLRREISFAAGDGIEIDLQPITTVRNGKTHISYEIPKVHSVTPGTNDELF